MELSPEVLAKLNYEPKTVNNTSQGDIFRLPLNRENGLILPDNRKEKPKFFIIMGLDEDYVFGISLINSKINTNKPPYYQINFHKLLAANYKFLKRDSYVDCNKFLELPASQMLSHDIPMVHQGELLSSDLEEIKNILRNCKAISKKDLQNYNII